MSCAPLSTPSQKQHRNHGAPDPPPQRQRNRHYTMPQKGSNYRMDGRRLYKHEAADRPGFKQVPAGLSYSRITQGGNTDTLSTSDAEAKKQKKMKLMTFFFFQVWCCVTVSGFQTSRRKWVKWVPRFDKWRCNRFSKTTLFEFNASRFQSMRSYSCFKHVSLPSEGMVTQRVWEKAQTGRHISLPLWHILQGNRSQTAWCWLSLTCYESIAGRGLSITLGGGSWGERTARRAGGGVERGRGSPVACHSSCTTAWPPTLSGLCTMGGPSLDCMSSHSPLPPKRQKCRGVCGEGGCFKTHRTDISQALKP